MQRLHRIDAVAVELDVDSLGFQERGLLPRSGASEHVAIAVAERMSGGGK
jgi:hypothetical protein